MKIIADYKASLLIIAVFLILKYSFLSVYLHEKIEYIIVFFIAIDYLIKILVSKGLENKGDSFISYFMASMVLKMVLFLIFTGFMIFKFPGNSQLLVINIFALYLFFTFFEISEILRKLRRF